MAKIAIKTILILCVGFLDFVALSGVFERAKEFEGQLPESSKFLPPGLLFGLLVFTFAFFVFRFWSDKKWWGWFAGANTLLVLASIILYSPVPGP